MPHIIFRCLLLVSVFLPALVMPVWAAGSGLPQETVIVYSWPDYMPEGLLDDFTRETGIKVNYSTYNNNEIMYTKLKLLKGRGYDVLVPSTYMVEKLRNEGLLQPIKKKLLSHYDQLDGALLNKSFDPKNEFSVPYLWGSVGLGINKNNALAAGATSWADLWNRHWQDKLLLLDDMRSVFAIALRLDGHSPNATAPEDIKRAYERLQTLMPNVHLFKSDKPRETFLKGEVEFGTLWSGDAVLAQTQNPAIQYIYPKEGAAFWMDNFVIPARASNPDNAHQFIDYMLRPEVAARCVKALSYATPNLGARKLLEDAIKNNPIIFPPAEVLEKAEFQRDVGEAMELYLDYWEKLKALGEKKSS